MKVLIIVEESGTGYSAYAPDLPGCIATGTTRAEVEKEMKEALEFHLEGMRAIGELPLKPHSYATVVEVAA
jgi:predicted RNase H-like HicB family nuclease